MSEYGRISRGKDSYHAWKAGRDVFYEFKWGKTVKATPAVAKTYRMVESDSMMVAICDAIAEDMFPDEPRSVDESDRYWVNSVLWTSDLPGMEWPNALVSA